jgi:hypothetical protein
MKKQTWLNAAVVVAITLLAFFGGIKYQESRQTNLLSQFGNGFGNNLNRTNSRGAWQNPNQQNQLFQKGGRIGNSARPISGEIISADNQSITIKQTDGSSRIIFFSDKTSINKNVAADKDDLKIGEKVMVIGQLEADGSVVAQIINLDPNLKGNLPNKNNLKY